jgi:3' terminal RNA ribose 2'-O-methyltransferase Hen1
MLLTITTTHRPARDLGYLLHKNPDRRHDQKLAFGTAHMFYPEAEAARATFALMLDVDPVALVRGRGGRRKGDSGGLLTQYVNDRGYAASSFLSVAMARCLGTAMSGRSKERQSLADSEIPLSARVTPLACRGQEDILAELFEPLGYEVSATAHELDAQNPEWGQSLYATVTVEGTCRIAALLSHLYVLIPVLDNSKHYWVGEAEIEKLLARGEGWLAAHPAKELITSRYLKYRGRLTREALARLSDSDEADPEAEGEARAQEEQNLEKPIRLHDRRLDAVVEALKSDGAKRVLDLGCGGGQLLGRLVKEKQFEEIVGLDASVRALEGAAGRLRLDRMPARKRERIKLLHGALTYRDARLEGFDAAAVVEVVEHLDPPRLDAFEAALFGCAKPATVVLTTPNIEYNAAFENLAPGALRHKDHRFEWTRREFADWAGGVAGRHGYEVAFLPIGDEDPKLGPPSQMGIFRRCD